ncbi:MAG: helix-turn-helix transcriptional regulator [Clostridia bacterium]|nr:helix-turn-helix transcriptional regulator [Clostridia bacterium]
MENNFKENLKQLRKEGGLSQTQLANALNLTVKTISHWETGYTEPSIKQILELAEFFHVSLEDLLCK